jgi:hypothetical protein
VIELSLSIYDKSNNAIYGPTLMDPNAVVHDTLQLNNLIDDPIGYNFSFESPIPLPAGEFEVVVTITLRDLTVDYAVWDMLVRNIP